MLLASNRGRLFGGRGHGVFVRFDKIAVWGTWPRPGAGAFVWCSPAARRHPQRSDLGTLL